MKRKIVETHKGMNMDISPLKFPENLYYSANNIRIAPSINGNNQFDVSNYKASKLNYTFTSPEYDTATSKIRFMQDLIWIDAELADDQIEYLQSNLLPEDYTINTMIGIVGYLNLSDYSIIIYDVENNGSNYNVIYKISDTNISILYIDDFGARYGSIKADIKYFYENESVYKIYISVDGNNILYFNIANSNPRGLKSRYEILPDISFNVLLPTKFYGSSYHTTGMIQYAYSAYFKNGASSSISPLSGPIYLTNSDGSGDDVNEFVTSIINISIPPVLDFDYIKVYSIKYNEGTDIPNISLIREMINPYDYTLIYDDNTIINSVSIDEFVYLGGLISKAKTIEIKDNRLFAGGITDDSFDINNGLDVTDSDYYDTRAYRFNFNLTACVITDISAESDDINISPTTFRDVNGNLPDKSYDCIQNDFDTYNNNTDGDVFSVRDGLLIKINAGAEGENIKLSIDLDESSSPSDVEDFRLKTNEIYRYGIRFINNKGLRSSVHWIADIKTPGFMPGGATTPTTENTDITKYYYKLSATIKNMDILYNKGVVSYEIMRVVRNDGDKTIVAQGLVTTMMFQTRGIDSSIHPDIRSVADGDGYYLTKNHSKAYQTREELSDDYILYPSLLPRTLGTVRADELTSNNYSSVQKVKHLQCLSLRIQDVLYGTHSDDSVYSDSYLDDFNGDTPLSGYTASQYPEIASSLTEGSISNRTNRTYQYSKMWQLFSPEIEFSNVQLAGVNTVSIIGGWKGSNLSTGSNDRVFYAGASLEAKEIKSDTGRVNKHSDTYNTNGYNWLLSHNNTVFHHYSNSAGIIYPAPSTYHHQLQYKWKFDKDFINYTDTTYELYGSPEIAISGIKNKVYNNDQSMRYSTSLDQVTTDDLELLNTHSKSNKSVILVPKYATLSSGTTDIDKINHVPLEVGLYEANSNRTNTTSDFPIIELRRELNNQYGGNTYEARSLNVYSPIGTLLNVAEVGDITSSISKPGDTFLHIYNLLVNGYDSNTDYADGLITHSVIFSFPIETSVNLNSRYDLSKNVDATFIPSFTNFSKYNTVYDRQADVFTSAAERFNQVITKYKPNTIYASKVKIPGELTDNFLDLLVNEELSLDGKYGNLNRLYNFKDTIFAFQDNGTSVLSINPRVTTTGEDSIQTELGTGGVLDRYKYISTDFGLSYKDFNSVCASTNTLYFYDRSKSTICIMLNSAMQDLALLKGFNTYVKSDTLTSNEQYIIIYNFKYNELVMYKVKSDKSTNKLIYNEILDAPISFDTDSLKELLLHFDNNIYSLVTNNSNVSLYKAYDANTYLPTSITYIVNPTQGYKTIRFDNIEWYSYASEDGVSEVYNTFDKFNISTDYQNFDGSFSSLSKLYHPKRKFRMWRVPLPREDRDRWRSVYMYLTLEHTSTTESFKFGDIVISYNL